ncbi:predicted protein [Nematostella vectensis]|uniref:Uncharacterized protein n=1 Tax=Nematostella vectensis TaxID=45351 RepID=A7RLF0_NEMVE|nr:circadian locomoter output cycles protein kaput [Nematostella vectensis]EDO47679.1 predicted protein [Nematostella vectensis]|eukprot:XP_001639742.1 predicted protein [Nematostella vectensis]
MEADDCIESMDDKHGPKISESKRVNRNMNEKKRRDRFNVLIGELASIISPSSRKVDKSTVLKKAIACLKSQKDLSPASCSKPREGWQPPFVSDPELCQLIIEAMDGFIMSIDSSGSISFVSDNITSQLGYLPEKIINTRLSEYLESRDCEAMDVRLQRLYEHELVMYRLPESSATATPLSDLFDFSLCMCYGPLVDSTGFAAMRCIAQAYVMQGVSHDMKTKPEITRKLNLVTLCCLETERPTKLVSSPSLKKMEFTARLTLNWKFTHLDQRGLSVIGYMSNELVGSSLYQNIHPNDLENITRYHKILVYKGRVNTCYYRFLTKGQAYLWIRSCCYISYNQWNSRPEFIIATSTTASQAEVTANQARTLQQDLQSFENLEQKQLISKTSGVSSPSGPTDMPSRSSGESTFSDLPMSDAVSVGSEPQNSKPLSPGSIISEPSSIGELVKSPALGSGNAFKASRLMSSGASVSQVLDSLLPSDVSDAGFGSDEDLPKEKPVSKAESPWNLPLPKGLSPTQYKLHEQLKDKHVLLEESIKRQIHELNKIKKQIEVNKDLWEFNVQIQKLRGPGSNLEMEDKNGSRNPDNENLHSDLSNLNLLQGDKQLRHLMTDLTDDFSNNGQMSLGKDFLSMPTPNPAYIDDELEDMIVCSSQSLTDDSGVLFQFPFSSSRN